jgi:hypothetical protein
MEEADLTTERAKDRVKEAKDLDLQDQAVA